MTDATVALAGAIQQLNQSGTAIPISLTSVNATEPIQFWVTTIIATIGVIFCVIWLCQMFFMPTISGIMVRISLYRFKQITGRNFILIKHTRNELFNSSMIDSNTLQNVETAIASFDGKPFDLIIHSPGGMIFFAQLLAKIIKGYPGQIRAFVPYYAMSGGTFLALACDEIHMGTLACLGPTDPQLGSIFGYGSARSWLEVVTRKGKKASDSSIQNAFVGAQYTATLRENIRSVLSDKGLSDERMEQILDFMTSGNIEHAFQISPEKLNEMGISVSTISGDVQKILSKVINKSIVEGVFYG